MADYQSLDTIYLSLLTPDSSDIWQHLPTFVEIIRELQATKVIELGVRAGVSTIGFLYGLQFNLGGHLWSMDGAIPCFDQHGDDLLGKYLSVPEAMQDWDSSKRLELPPGTVVESRSKAWTFIQRWDFEEGVTDLLPHDADIIFLDTNHIYEETLVELATYTPLVRSGGRFLLHDTDTKVTGNAVTPQPDYPVLTAMTEFCNEHQLKWTNNPACNGLGQIFL